MNTDLNEANPGRGAATGPAALSPITSQHVRVLHSQLDLLERTEREALADYRKIEPRPHGSTPDREHDRLQTVLFDIQDRIAAKRVALAQLEGAESQAAASRAAAENQAVREDASFWLRRLIVSLSIANGAAFVGLISGAFHTEHPLAVAAIVAPSLHYFGLGLIFAGAIPAAMWLLLAVPRFGVFILRRAPRPPRQLDRARAAYEAAAPTVLMVAAAGLALASTLFFLQGLAVAIVTAQGRPPGMADIRDLVAQSPTEPAAAIGVMQARSAGLAKNPPMVSMQLRRTPLVLLSSVMRNHREGTSGRGRSRWPPNDRL